MAKIRKASEVLSQDTGALSTYPASHEWIPIEAKFGDKTFVFGFDHPKKGRVELVYVCDDAGKPKWGQYEIREGPAIDAQGNRPVTTGAVIVPYFKEAGVVRVGLIERVRELLIDPATGAQGNYRVVELPRGFSNVAEAPEGTAHRELGEETGKVAIRVKNLGRVNANSAFYTGFAGVFAAEVDPAIQSKLRPDAKELILKCNFVPYDKVRALVRGEKIDEFSVSEIVCGFTLASLMKFDANLEQLVRGN